jgi:hypothetical protein
MKHKNNLITYDTELKLSLEQKNNSPRLREDRMLVGEKFYSIES